MKRTAVALLIGLVLADTNAHAQSADELLVLGIRGSDGALSTVLVDGSGIRKAGSGIAVPRPKGWWKLDLISRRRNSFEESILFAHDTRKVAKDPAFQFNEGCESSTSETLLFVGPDHFSKEISSKGKCQTGEPWSYALLATVTYDSSESLAIADVLGKEIAGAWQKAADKAHGGAKKREKACLSDAREEEWSIARQKGQWELRGELSNLDDSCRGKHEYFLVETVLPAKTIGGTTLPQSWAKYAAIAPGLVDAVASPSSELLVLVTQDHIEVRTGDKTLGRLDESKVSIVMAQWAVGATAAQWREEVRQLFAREQADAQTP